MSLSDVCSVHIAVSPPSTLPQEVRVTSGIAGFLSRGEDNIGSKDSFNRVVYPVNCRSPQDASSRKPGRTLKAGGALCPNSHMTSCE